MRCILLLFCLSVTLTVSGQLQPGDRLLIPTTNYFSENEGFAPPISQDLGAFRRFWRTTNNSSLLTVTPKLGFMVSNRFLVGGRTGIRSVFTEFTDWRTFDAEVFSRYYFRNAPALRVFGEFGGTFRVISFEGRGNDEKKLILGAGAGLSLNLTDGVFLTPLVSYDLLYSERNELTLNLGIECLLGSNNRPVEKVKGRYGKGSLMAGAYVGNLFLTSNETSFYLSPQAHYFLTDRFALGLNSGIGVRNYSNGSESKFHGGISVRYFVTRGNHIDLFVHAGGGAGSSAGIFRAPSTFYEGGMGVLLFLRERIALEAGLSGNKYSDIGISELSVSTGVRFFLWSGQSE